MDIGLGDKFHRLEGRVFLTGMEAIVRLVLEKQRHDQAAGAVNQTYFTGYEGSPLGGLDLKLVEQMPLLNQVGRTVHQFGINEKTAASAILGSQFAQSGDIDAFWYGKAHGTMWIPDEMWLANLSGTGQRGSIVLLSGEDHRSKSSVSPGASDWVLRSSMVPIFYPADVEDIIRLGLHAVALSRHTGVATALKMVTPVCDGASTVDLDRVRPEITLPQRDFDKCFNQIVMATRALPMQRQLVEEKWPLVEAYIRANDLNRFIDADAGGAVGIVATGKSYTDVRQALDYLGLRVPILQLAVSIRSTAKSSAPSPAGAKSSSSSKNRVPLSKRRSRPHCGAPMSGRSTANSTSAANPLSPPTAKSIQKYWRCNWGRGWALRRSGSSVCARCSKGPIRRCRG